MQHQRIHHPADDARNRTSIDHLIKSTAVVPSKPYQQGVAFSGSDQLQQIPLDGLVDGRIDGHAAGVSISAEPGSRTLAACHTKLWFK